MGWQNWSESPSRSSAGHTQSRGFPPVLVRRVGSVMRQKCSPQSLPQVNLRAAHGIGLSLPFERQDAPGSESFPSTMPLLRPRPENLRQPKATHKRNNMVNARAPRSNTSASKRTSRSPEAF